jgi:AcrR family transcriptional regulator
VSTAAPSPSEKTYGGLDAGQRQAGRRERIRATALDLIATGGTTAVSINSVCTAAGLNKRYCYESYESREALLVDLLTAFFDDFYARAARDLAAVGSDVEGRARNAVASLLSVLESDPGVARLYAESGSEPSLAEVRTAQFERFTEIAAALIGADAADPRARYALRALVIGVTEALMHWLREDPASMDREQVLDTSVRFLLAAVSIVTD